MVFVPKTDWQDSPSTATPITAAHLIRIETGIQGAARDATETLTGNVELATAGEMTTGTDLVRVPSVKRVADYVASVLSGLSYATQAYVVSAISSPFSLISELASDIPLTIKGAISQTAKLLVVKDSNEAILASIDQLGQVTAGADFTGNAMLKAKSRGATIPGVRVQGAVSHTGFYYVAEDSSGVNKFTVDFDGTVNGANIGTPPGTSLVYSPLMVLDAAAAVPSGTRAGTIILRRPA
jgi:hypothetical protein